MNCPQCHAEVEADDRFCTRCGGSLALRCPQCGAETRSGSRFCHHCGNALDLTAGGKPKASTIAATDRVSKPEDDSAENRQMTVLFCDLVDSTGLQEELGEQFWIVLHAYREACRMVVDRFDGEVAEYVGDGVVVYFGVPIAHEDDAQRAVRAGLGILDAIRRLSPTVQRDHGVDLEVRITGDTGPVVAHSPAGGGRPAAYGRALILASRLKAVARPQTLVVSDDTHRLVRGYFQVRNLGPRDLGRVGHVAAVYEVIRETTARNRLDVSLADANLTPLAGRDADVNMLRDLWENVRRSRHGHVVLISGEPGIGKSRLVRTLEQHVSEEPDNWLTSCSASPYYTNTAFHPIIGLLERVVLEFRSDDDPEQKRAKLAGWLVEYGLPVEETAPLFSRLLSLPVRETDLLDPDPKVVKQKTMATLLRVLLARSAEQTVLFVCEDLHWADPSTLELLDLIVQAVAEVPVLVVLTFRPEFPPAWQEHVTHVALDRLGSGPSAQIAQAAAGGLPLPEALLNQILHRTDGVPLFIEELARMVREAGLLREVSGRFELTGTLPAIGIPMTLRDSLLARLDRLGRAKSIAQVAAVLGREFPYRLLQRVTATDTEDLVASLDRLVDADLLFQSGTAPFSSYVFKHALIQEAASDLLLTTQRRELHRRVADVLVDEFPELSERQPELIAHHYLEGDRRELSLDYWRRAGERALERAANVEAIAHLERAHELLMSCLPGGTARDERELQIQHRLAPAYMAIKGWASLDVERTCRRALELSGNQGDFGSLWGLWTNYFLRGRMREALETGQQVLRLATQVGPLLDPTHRTNTTVMAHHAVGYSHFYRGEFQAAQELAESGLTFKCLGADAFDIDSESEMVRMFQFSSSAALRMMLGCSLWMLGYPDRGSRIVRSAVDLTRQLNHYPSEAYAQASTLLLHHYQWDVTRAEQTVNRLLTLARQESFEIWTPFALMFQGWTMAEKGDGDGIALTRRGLDQWRATGSYLNQTIISGMLATSLRKVGRIDEALDVLSSEIVASAQREELHFAPELHRLRGEILLERGRCVEGEAELECARDLARGQHALMLELRALTSLCRVWAATGRSQLAVGSLSSLYGKLTEGFSTPDASAARVLLQELQAPNESIHEPAGLLPP
jgi:class 3 adenylate cyclase/tetratricopeptide (TPR) repeat protein